MRATLKKLLETLGVGRVLAPYETHPWLHYDAEKALSCSAEVRMGPGGEDIEAEIQFIKDEGSESGDQGGGQSSGGVSGQIMHMRATPYSDDTWTPVSLRVKGKEYTNEIHDWETKGCNFFRAVVESLQMSITPDIDALIEKELGDDDNWGGGRGKIGRKAPKIKPAQLMGLNKRGM